MSGSVHQCWSCGENTWSGQACTKCGAPEELAPCVHYWVIDTAQGPTSTGRCKLCRLVRTDYFSNYVGDTIFHVALPENRTVTE